MCWLIANFIDDLRVGGDPGGNWWSPSPSSSMKAAQIEATKLTAIQGRVRAAYRTWGGESSCLSTSSGPNIEIRLFSFYMFALRHALRHARRFSSVANKTKTIDVVQTLEHEYTRLLRVVKKRIDDRKHLASKVLAGYPHFTNILPELFSIRFQMKYPPQKILRFLNS